MHIRVGFDLTFETPGPVPLLLMLYVHPSRAGDLVHPEQIHSHPNAFISTFIDMFGNRCGRVVSPTGLWRLTHEAIVRDSGLTDAMNIYAPQSDIAQLPENTIPFLFASRYCEVDRLTDIAWSLFGNTPPGWQRVQAVCDWVHNNVRFGYQFARPTKTAFEVYTERTGVCRDFSHLLITMLRCLSIPARYATGYLGDIGVPIDPAPMDFSAWTEVFIGGNWYTFDGRHNQRRIGRIVMARGRDAADVALTTSFGKCELKKFCVITHEQK
jgi:transglutaminase-like putative cysteine protease